MTYTPEWDKTSNNYSRIFTNCVEYIDLKGDDGKAVIGNNGTLTGTAATTNRFGSLLNAQTFSSDDTLAFTSVGAIETKLSWEDTGSGWVLNREPSYLSNVGVSSYTGDLGEIFLFSDTKSTAEIDEIENLTKQKMIYPYMRGVRE